MEFELRALTHVRNTSILLDSVSLTIQPGEFVCLIGPSGAGKSTLLRQLCRLDPKTQGEILWRGQPVEHYDVRSYRRQVAYVFQKNAMFEGTVRDNLAAALTYGPAEADGTDPLTRMAACLALVGLEIDTLGQTASSLSGGQQQRVGIARALMMNPAVLLLDEPTASLDVESSNHFLRMLRNLRSQPRPEGPLTVVMVTHRLEEAKFLADTVVMLAKGAIVETTPAREFFAGPRTQRARDFLAAEVLQE